MPTDRPLRFWYIEFPNSLLITHAHKIEFNFQISYAL